MKLKLRDLFVFLLCFLILAACSYYLYWDFHAKPELRGAEKQGYITFKYKVAQRKFPSRMIWEDVEQMLPIYDKDSIRTDFLSEAIVTLNNGVKIELDPDSMFVLNIHNKKVDISLEKGSFLVSTTKPLSNPNDFSLKHKNVELSFQEKMGEIKILENHETLEIVSQKGSTAITMGEMKETIFEKQKAKLNIPNKKLEKTDPVYLEMLPTQNTRYFIDEDTKEVNFEWKSKNEMETEIEISTDRFFKDIFFSSKLKGQSFTKKFSDGVYYWKLLSPSGETSEIKKFRVIKNPAFKLIAPANKTQFKNQSGESLVNFLWNKRVLALSYHFEIANDISFKNPIFARNIFKTNISIPLGLGEYFWRVRSFDSIQGASPKTEVYSFTVEKEGSLPSSLASENEVEKIEEEPAKPTEEVKTIADTTNKPQDETPTKIKEPQVNKITNPVLLFPRPNSVVDMNKLDSLNFKWSKVAGAKSYTIKFIQQSTGEVILQSEVLANNFNFTQLDKLDVGVFAWTIDAIPGLEETEKTSTTAKFTITLAEQPAAPETISKGKKEE